MLGQVLISPSVAQMIDSFIEGPIFDIKGNLYITDIPYREDFSGFNPSLEWELVLQYDGWPNGLAFRCYREDYGSC
jgi:hypothetical protein